MKFKYKILTTSLLTALSVTAVNAQQNPGFAIEDVQLNVAEQVNYLYFLRNKIKSLRTHLRLTESLAEIDNSAKV